MWSPTHVQVLVKKARGLKIKGKDGTNDAFVTIGLGKEKYQTSVKEKATESVEWCEQCELSIPSHGNTAEIVLTALHRNFLGVDEFLGLISIPLKDFDVYDRPRTKWYKLQCKPGQGKNDYRGELEVRTAFTVKATQNEIGSTADLSGKSKNSHKGSLQSLNKAAANFGGSLLNLGQKEKKHLKKIAKSVTHKVEKVGEKAKSKVSSVSSAGKNGSDKGSPEGGTPEKLDNSLNRFSDPFAKIKGAPSRGSPSSGGRGGGVGGGRLGRNFDPGVNSDDEDDDDMFKLDALSHGGSSGSSLNMSRGNMVDNMGTVSKTSTPLSGSLENLGGGELLRKTHTPSQPRRSGRFAPNQDSPLVLSDQRASDVGVRPSPKVPTTEDMDDWELKLLGKKGAAPFTPSEFKSQRDNLSMISGMSGGGGGGGAASGSAAGAGGVSLAGGNSLTSGTSSRTNTLERPSRLNMPQQTPSGHKKKIIPVQSDFESSPSPEDSPSSPSESRDNSPVKEFVNRPTPPVIEEENKKKKLLGKFTKTSLSFRSDKDRSSEIGSNSPRQSVGGHSRTYSDGSAGSNTSVNAAAGSGQSGGPPRGQRIVLGRETTPTEQPQKIPKDVWDKFDGKSREDLIEMIVGLQETVEDQARKQSDLEDYIDSLLMKVLSTAPQLLNKASPEGRNSPNAGGWNISKRLGLW